MRRPLYDADYDKAIDVGPGLAVLHFPRHNPGHHGWGIRHACPGTYRAPGDDDVYVVAPFIASDIVREDPITFTPSILCLGAGNPCGLHGFVTDGVWVDAGTPPETLACVRDN